MDQPSISPNVLVAPLDWGLGHATRCVPLIRELLQQHCKVVLAASGKGKALLQQEFPDLPMLDLPGYDIEYASTAWGLAVKIVAQIPKLLSAIKEEQLWLKKVVAEEGIHAVISDNRYGLNHPTVPCIFLTHQLCIKAPLQFAEDLLQNLAYDYINRFTECWVPDEEGESNLAGELSHPQALPEVPVYYTGPLTRFQNSNADRNDGSLLLLLSGPEPQRTLLEERFLEDLQAYHSPVVFVRGLPGEAEPLAVAENVTVYNHLPARELEQKIREASIVISRCGYSTVMDLATLQKPSILIPTPGQTEQEYLSRHLMQKNLAFCVAQKKFRLDRALELAGRFSYQPFPQQSGSALKQVVARLVSSLKEKRSIVAS